MSKLRNHFSQWRYVLFFMLASLSLQAQLDTITLNLQDQYACVGDTVFVPLTVTNFHNVEAIQLNIDWDASTLEYIDTCNLAVSGLSVNQTSAGHITAAWFAFNAELAVDLMDNDTLIIFKFNVLDLSSNNLSINFVPINEIAFFDGAQSVSYPLDLSNSSIFLNEIINLQTTSTIITCQDTLADLSAISEVSPTNYIWTGSNGFMEEGSAISVRDSGAYTVIASSGNCRDTAIIELMHDTIPPDILNVSGGLLSCANANVTLDAQIMLNADFEYSWINPSNDTLFTNATTLDVDSTGIYTFIATDVSNGCIATDTAFVDELYEYPDIMVADTLLNLDCIITNQTLYAFSSVPNTSFLWLDENTAILGNSDSLVINTIGIYTVEITNTDNLCTSETSITITENLTLPDISIQGNTNITCTDSTTILTATVNNQDSILFSWADENIALLNMEDSLVVNTASEWFLIAEHSESGCRDTLSVQTTIDTASTLLPLFPLMDTIDCISSIVTFTAMNITPNLNLEWQDMSQNVLGTTPSIDLDSAGQYILQVLNTENGCISEKTFTVAIDTITPDIILPIADTLTCLQEEINLSIQSNTPNISCEWISFGTNCDISISSEGIYTGMLTNLENGCTNTANVSIDDIRNSPMTTISASNILDCQNTSSLIQVSDTLANTLYEWYTSNGSFIIADYSVMVDIAESYSLVLTDTLSGCTYTDSIIITENYDLPDVVLSISDTLSCYNEMVELSNDNINDNITIQWQDATGMMLPSTSIAEAGIYYAEIINTSNNCMVIDSIEVVENFILPQFTWTFDAQPAIITCFQPEVTVSPTATPPNLVNFHWEDTVGNTISVEDVFIFTTAASFNLVATNIESGCITDTLLQVTEDTAPPIIEFNMPEPLNCLSGETVLSSTFDEGYTYLWSANTPNSVESPNQSETFVFNAETYQLIVTNTNNGCQSTGEILISNLGNGPQSADITIIQPNCSNSATTGNIIIESIVGGNAPFTYNLDNNGASSQTVYTNLIIGDYPLTVTDDNGCTWDTLFTINEPIPINLEIMADAQFITLGDAVQLSFESNVDTASLTQIQWQTANGSLICMGCLIINDTISVNTTYQLLLTSLNGCSANTSIEITVSQDIPVFIPNAFSPNDDGFNDYFSLFASKNITKINRFQIFNRWGDLVFETEDIIFPNSPSQGWDGKHHGKKMKMDVFVYAFEVEVIDGSRRFYSGEVILVR